VRLGLMGLRYQYTECRTFYQSLAKEKCPVKGCAPCFPVGPENSTGFAQPGRLHDAGQHSSDLESTWPYAEIHEVFCT
jgi:hypothetical protein